MKRNALRDSINAERERCPLTTDPSFQDFQEQWQEFQAALPASKKEYKGNARAAKTELDQQRAGLTLTFFDAYAVKLLSLVPAWRATFVDGTLGKVVPQMLQQLQVFEATLQQLGEPESANAADTVDLLHAAKTRLLAMAGDMDQRFAERQTKATEELQRIRDMLVNAPGLFSEQKRLMEDKDFRRRLRKIENRMSDFRSECVQVALAVAGDQVFDAAMLALLRLLTRQAVVSDICLGKDTFVC